MRAENDRDRGAIAAVVLTWPDRSVTWETAKWLWGLFRPDRILSVCRRGRIDEVRNWTVREVCLKAPPDVQHFLFLDRDMRPSALTTPILEAEGDVVGAMYPLGNPWTWADEGMVHAGCLRVSRRVLEALAPGPWFRFEFTADGADLTRCECSWFAERAREKGFTVRRAGWCDHAPLRA